MAASSSSWPFCPQCGNILDTPGPASDTVNCAQCAYRSSFSKMTSFDVVTTSAPRPKPAWISEEEASEDPMKKHATIEQECPKCGHPELIFYTMQIRSVDEGSTVFYECPSCSHKYAQNN